MSLFPKNLRFLRKKGKQNQDEISLLFNKRANTIGNWENGKSEPSITELIELGNYFKVSTQDLLHTDLEKVSFQQSPETATTEPSATKIKYYSQQDPVMSVASESSPDGFWFILKELKSLNEKLDLLVSGVESGAHKKNSDKSNH